MTACSAFCSPLVLFFALSLPFPPPPPAPPYPPPTLRAKTPRGSRSNPNPAFSKSFAGKLFSQSPQKAERLPDTTKPARVSLPLALPPVLFFFLYFSPSFLPRSPPSFMPATFPRLTHCSRLTFRQWKPAAAEVAD